MISSRGSGSITTTNAGLTIAEVLGFVCGLVGFIALLILSIWWWRRPKGGKTRKKQEQQTARQYDYQSAGLGITLSSRHSSPKRAALVLQHEIPQIRGSPLYRSPTFSPKILQSLPAAILSPPQHIQHSMTINIEPPTPTIARGRTTSTGQRAPEIMSPIPEARAVLLDRLNNVAHTHPKERVEYEVPSDASSQYSHYPPEHSGLPGASDTTDASESDMNEPNKQFVKDHQPLFNRGLTVSQIMLKSESSDVTDISQAGHQMGGYRNLGPSGNGNRLVVPRPLNVVKRNGEGDQVDIRGLGVGYLESELDELSRANSTRR